MNRKTLDSHIVSTPGIAGGKPRIAGHRIRVQDVVIWHQDLRMKPEEIAAEYQLTLAEVYAALAYYHDHREAIDKIIVDDDAFVEAMRKKTPSKLTEKVKGKRDARTSTGLHR